MTLMSQALNRPAYRDIAGASASFLCVLHCLVTPLLITVLPVLAATETATHRSFAVFILVIGMLAFVPGYRKHRKKVIPAAGAIGISAIIAAAVLPEMAGGELFETTLVVSGGLTLIGAHLRNAYWCRFCRVCNDKPCT